MSERFDIDVGSWDLRDMDPRNPDPRDELPSRAECEAEEERRAVHDDHPFVGGWARVR